jgi:hypothetical protein
MTDDGLIHLNRLTQLHSLSLSSPKVTDAGLTKLRLPPDVHELILDLPAVTDAGIVSLPALPNLTSLVLNVVDVGEAGINHLVAGGKLEQLRIYGGHLGDACLPAIGKNVNLRYRLHLAGRPITDAGLAYVAGLVNVGAVDLSGTQVTDAGLRHLQQMRLQYLNLKGTRITGAGLQHLQPNYLREIDLSDTQVTDEGLKHLQGMKRLMILALRNAPISGGGLKSLQSAPELRELDLSGAAITDDGMASLATFQHLDKLALGGTAIGDAGCQHLPVLSFVERKLDLSSTKITDACIPALVHSETRDLNLDNAAITDTGLVALAELLNHKYDSAKISLKGTKVTPAGIRRLDNLWHSSDRFGQFEHDFADEQVWPNGRNLSGDQSDLPEAQDDGVG